MYSFGEKNCGLLEACIRLAKTQMFNETIGRSRYCTVSITRIMKSPGIADMRSKLIKYWPIVNYWRSEYRMQNTRIIRVDRYLPVAEMDCGIIENRGTE